MYIKGKLSLAFLPFANYSIFLKCNTIFHKRTRISIHLYGYFEDSCIDEQFGISEAWFEKWKSQITTHDLFDSISGLIRNKQNIKTNFIMYTFNFKFRSLQDSKILAKCLEMCELGWIRLSCHYQIKNSHHKPNS